MNYLQFDLNLLIVLNTLLAERNVSRAALRLGITQPAVSNALSRLRSHFKDPLLVRAQKGMQPTPLAKSLEGPVKDILRDMDSKVFSREAFNPKTSTHVFTIAATDYCELVILPKLCEALCVEAPNIKLNVRPMTQLVPVQDLAEGRIDLALGFFIQEPVGLYQQTLYKDRMILAARKGHPYLKEKPTLKNYVKYRHAVVAPWGGAGSKLETLLGKKGYIQNVSLRVPHFFIGPLVVAETSLLILAPRRVLMAFSAYGYPIELREPPIERPEFPASQMWHERTHKEPAHKWLRQRVHDLSQSV